MHTLKPLNAKEVKGIRKLLFSQYGFSEKLDYAFFLNNKDKIYIITKDLAGVDTSRLRIDTLGMYFGTLYNDELRLSIEGSQIIGKQAAKNILELDKKQFDEYIKGFDVEIKGTEAGLEKGFFLIRHKNDFYGCAKLVNDRLLNFIPKARRLKVVNE
ncbi:MAG: hypothetical protein V1743_05150 [Nanoarchaeota archaeon]